MNEAPPIISGASHPSKTPLWTKALIAFVVCLPVLYILSWITAPIIAVYKADEGFKRAVRTIDPEPLRAWALKTVDDYAADGIRRIPTGDIPGPLQNLYVHRPNGAAIYRYQDGNSTVVIFWGGGFFHWAMEIGDTNFIKPFVNENSDYRYNFEWTNGIYYTREAEWKLW
jgi:hypothetical protein